MGTVSRSVIRKAAEIEFLGLKATRSNLLTEVEAGLALPRAGNV